MKLTIKQDKIAKALASAGRVATTKAGLPILSNILLRTNGGHLVVAATDLEIASTHTVTADIETQGEITVPAKLISEFISNLPRSEVSIEVKGTRVSISSGGYSSVINGIDATDFPELPVIDEDKSIQYAVRVDDFKQASAQTIFACSSDTTRPVLTGVFWHSHEGGLYLAGTDGYRLAEKRLIDTASELAAIVPTTSLQEVLRCLGDDSDEVEVLFDETQVRFRINDTEITSRLIDGKYPNYRQLIPTQHETAIQVAVSDIVRTVKIAALFARSSGGSVTLKAQEDDSSFSVQSIASEVGENNSKSPAVVTGDGEITLNSRYLIEVLSVIAADTIDIEYSGKLAPLVVRATGGESDYLHIIMPLKS